MNKFLFSMRLIENNAYIIINGSKEIIIIFIFFYKNSYKIIS